MLPDPMHPAIVHFPIVLALLAPLAAAGALIAIRRGANPLVAWGVPTALAAALALSTWVAVETGQAQEERVERVVSEQAIGTHEEGAEAFLAVAAALLGVTALGLVRGRVGRVGRAVAAVGTLAVVGMSFSVGRSGGELVYRHGAAGAYASSAQGGVDDASPAARERDEDKERGER